MNTLFELVSLGCRFFLAGLFMYASYDKAWEPRSFAEAVANYDILPIWALNSASVLTAWLEVWIAILLFIGLFTRAAALWACMLLFLFTGLLFYAGMTGAGYDCGCFPGQTGGHEAGYGSAFRDILFFLAAVWVLIRPGAWLRLDRLIWRAPTSGLAFEGGFPPRLR